MSTLSVSKTPREFHIQQFRVQTLNVKPLFNLIGDGMYYFCGPMKTLQWVMVWNILRHKSGFLYFMFRHYSLLPFGSAIPTGVPEHRQERDICTDYYSV